MRGVKPDMCPADHCASTSHADCLDRGLNGERVAAMITAFRIGFVLSDTIQSILAQRDVHLTSVLLVIDGCPEVNTTYPITKRYLAAYPGVFNVLWLENGGVSRARNLGIQWLLRRNPDLSAIYCLDGDDLISTTAIATSLKALRNAEKHEPDKKFGWVFTNKKNFGDDYNYIEVPEHFRRTSYLTANLSQPSCLYNADMFRSGLCWDETMRSGIEDWEFWLAAIAQGYEGVFNSRDVLYYRRLMGNRSSTNRRNDAYNVPYMYTKHASMLRPQTVLDDEQATAPRYAFGVPWGDTFDFTTDPGEIGQQAPIQKILDALGGRLQRGRPQQYIYDPYAPDILCLMWSPVRDILMRKGLMRGLLMMAETMFSHGAALVEGLIEPFTPKQREHAAEGDVFVFPIPNKGIDFRRSGVSRNFFFVNLSKLNAIGAHNAQSKGGNELVSRILVRSDGMENVDAYKISYEKLLEFLNTLKQYDDGQNESRIGAAQMRGNRLYISGVKSSTHSSLTQASIGTTSLFPQVSGHETTHIAIILPFDGLTNAVVQLMREISRRPGPEVKVSLFSPREHLPQVPQELSAQVENLSSLAYWVGKMPLSIDEHNVGVPKWEVMSKPLVARLAGLLASFAHVICFDLQMFAPVMHKLKSLGVYTVFSASENSFIPNPDELRDAQLKAARLMDDPVAMFNYAACYKRIICSSQKRADLLSALGCPPKLIDVGFASYLENVHSRPAVPSN